jgi:hypothetical protein
MCGVSRNIQRNFDRIIQKKVGSAVDVAPKSVSMSSFELHGLLFLKIIRCVIEFVLIEKQKHPPADGTSTRPTLPFEYWQPIQARLLRQGSGNFPNKKYSSAMTATGDTTERLRYPDWQDGQKQYKNPLRIGSGEGRARAPLLVTVRESPVPW